MTNADIVLKALLELAEQQKKVVTASEVMWQVRRDGWQMTTDKARGVLRVLARRGAAECIREGRRYFFRAVQS